MALQKLVESTATYEGETNVKGFKHGTGILTWDDGDQFVGRFDNDDRVFGTFTWKGGDQYTGEWRNNLMHGKGMYTYSDGKKYEGEWVNGSKEGKGILTFPNGDKYEGDFVKDQCHGFGSITYADGKTFSGQWEDNRRHGWGILYCSNGVKYQGCWQNNHLNGSVLVTDEKGRRFEEQYHQDQRKGSTVSLKRTDEEISAVLDKQNPPAWVADNEFKNCYLCNSSFTLLNRRHHCRNCGLLFCGKCSGKKLLITRFQRLESSRVCNECYLAVQTSGFRLPNV
eukprot:TRINITY_DN4361_c0_g1_i1.p1 TRINITY_DN4361_c0_g1~~TRINITY_DN4361_c0_g1_i1.p1  ORF type:complete len:298 (+),score=23.11 TRINITY_DN4361_c0_g1_i1:50-895(+)